jgi:hypothetical protein
VNVCVRPPDALDFEETATSVATLSRNNRNGMIPSPLTLAGWRAHTSAVARGAFMDASAAYGAACAPRVRALTQFSAHS